MIKKYFKLYGCLALMLFSALLPLKVFAVDYGFYSANDILFYDPSADCSGSSGSSSGQFNGTNAEALRYPSCATDDNKFANIIDNYIQNYSSSSPMKGLGSDFVKYGKQYNVNPAWAVAEAEHETSFGSAGVGQSCTNAFGIRTHSPYPDCGGFSRYSSFSQSLQDFYKLVSGPVYLGNPKNKTLLDIINIYAPVGDGSNDPTAYVKALLQPMTTVMKQACGSWSLSSGSSSTGSSSGSSSSSQPLEGVQTITVKGQTHKIPSQSGTAGVEGHLAVLGPNGDHNSLPQHYALTNVPKALQLGWSGGVGPSSGAHGTNDPVEEQYYIDMRWIDSSSTWYNTHPRVLVTNTKNNKQLVAAVVDYGPSITTGHVAGLSYESRAYLQYTPSTTLNFAWAKDQTLTPGPADQSSNNNIPSTNSTNNCSSSPSSSSGYQNPLRDVKNARFNGVDDGVDYTGSGPVYAIGNAKIDYYSTSTGWPGPCNGGAGGSGCGNYIGYTLSDGPAKGKSVYFAENCTLNNKLKKDDTIDSNTVICELHDTYPYCETGWSSVGTDSSMANYYQGITAFGSNFNAFMISLGAPKGSPTSGGWGKLPSGWSTKW